MDDSQPSTSKGNIWEEAKMTGQTGQPSIDQGLEDDILYDIEGVDVFDQQMLEKTMMEKMDQAVKQKEKQLEQKRASREIKQVLLDIREVKASIAKASHVLEIVTTQEKDKETKKRLESIRCQKINKEKQLKTLEAKLKRLQRVAGGHANDTSAIEAEIETAAISEASSSTVQWALTGQNHEERERLIKMGVMTPFGSVADDSITEKTEDTPHKRKVFLDDGFNDFLTSQSKSKKEENREKFEKETPAKTKNKQKFTIPKKKKTGLLKSWLSDADDTNKTSNQEDAYVNKESINPVEEVQDDERSDSSDKEYVPGSQEMKMAETVEMEDEELMPEDRPKMKRRLKQPRYDPDTGQPIFSVADENEGPSLTKKTRLKQGTSRIIDDGKMKNYKSRLEAYRRKLNEESLLGIEQEKDKDLGGGFIVPGRIWSKLYKYQKTGVRWLWELHSQQVGGILGDEMGLGKTIQIIAFLAGLHHSKVRSRGVPGHGYDGLGPVLIITPTTVMHQWVKELHTWWPPLRAAVLHDSGTYEGSRAQLVDNIVQSNGVLLTSYERARINVETLLDHGWHYVILDEGHKIRNPEAAVTAAMKLFRTPHRLILSGSPVQNNLRELWSLFDFIFPGKLGTLPVFMEQFSIPIVQGGYSNATEIQVHTAYKCACKLRDTISPYLLRRMKRDVQASLELPAKNEQVLFCRLTEHQVEVYKKYLDSDAVHSILCREMKVFAGLIQLRKICNHPDLYTGGPKLMVGEPEPSPRDERSFGFYKRSGKMLVISSLLKIWKKQGHKVLLFSQSKAMVDILETFVHSRGYTYVCMHGGTPVQSRQPLIKRFNEDNSIFVFLLTTRVGGLGVNLTGANRVVIYDPDWNPSTDAQAQERSWRIGQQRDVTIYRLLTSGTIEEKIYHRQIFKQFLTNRILKDPLQRRFFKSNDLHELFILKDHTDMESSKRDKDYQKECTTETAAIFAGTGSEIRPSSSPGKIERSGKRQKKPIRSSLYTFKPIKPEKDKKKLAASSLPAESSRRPLSANDIIQIDDEDISEMPFNLLSNHEKSKTHHPQIHEEISECNEAIVLQSTEKLASEKSGEGPEKQHSVQIGHSGLKKLPHDTNALNTKPDFDESQEIPHEDDVSTASAIQIKVDDIPYISTEPCERKTTENTNTGIPNGTHNEIVDFEAGQTSQTMKNDNVDENGNIKSSSSALKESLLRAKLKFEQRKLAERTNESKSRKVRKKKKIKRQPVVDGELVSNVVAAEDYKGAKESREEMERKSRKATDDYVLDRLFKKAGVHSALQHNTIMDSAHPDFALVEAEAERVAKESVRNLKLSRRQYQFPTGQPRSSPKLRFGKIKPSTKQADKDDSAVFKAEQKKEQLFKASHLQKALNGNSESDNDESKDEDSSAPFSASQLLSSMRRRNHEQIQKQEEVDAAEVSEENELFGFSISQSSGSMNGLTKNPTEHDELMTELRNYIAFQCEVDGQAKTSEIMREFGNKVKPQHAAVFKSILRELCHSSTIPWSTEKLWTLKPDFR